MVAACYSNPNWDGKDNADKRTDFLKQVNDHFNQAITAIYYPDGPREAVVDWDNPFYAAHRREMLRTKELFERATGKTLGDVIEEDEKEDTGVDQRGKTNGRLRERDYDQIPDDDDGIPRNR